MNPNETALTIHAVAEHTGVSEHTLRAWQRRYGVSQPGRHRDNRYRLYDEQDIADVLWFKRQIEAGIKPAQARLLFQQRRPARVIRARIDQPLAATRDALLAALIASDEPGATRILDEAFSLFAPEQVAVDILQPALVTIGDQWAQNAITIWQEHFAANLIRRKLFAVLQTQPGAALPAPVIAACAPTEEHEMGLITFALLAQRQG